ncbi:hypothetical protein OROGR_019636 [Orobanche gracilis]
MSDHHHHFVSQNLKHSFSLSDTDPNMELLNHFTGPIYPYSTTTSVLMGMGYYPNDNTILLHQLSECPGNLENYPAGRLLIIPDDEITAVTCIAEPVILDGGSDHKDRKTRATTNISAPESISPHSSPYGSRNGIRKTNRVGRGKKVKRANENEDENPREVVHVRAKRGQATDSHSLAERGRRRKINEKLGCLQDIVPGCYKTMGMAVMLDEIINYVQSLQSQVEFLSTRLTAASTVYDFNSNTDAMWTMQRAKAFEAMNGESIAPIDQGFGYWPRQYGS